MPPTPQVRIFAFAASVLLALACGPEVRPSAALSTPESTGPQVTAKYELENSGNYFGFVGDQNLRARDFPPELNRLSPAIDPDLAASIATEFIKNTRIAIGRDVLIDFCTDGKGVTRAFSVASAFVNQPISWMLEPNTAEMWNQPTVIIEFDDPELDIPGFHLELIVQGPFNGMMPSWFPSGVGNNTVVFDNPACGE